MKEAEVIIACLERTPTILNILLKHIPEKLYKTRRVEEKWSIHEQVCHLVDAQNILIARFQQFEKETNPLIKTYNPPANSSSENYLKLNMKAELDQYDTA